jgi:nicotinamidase-related amidase
MKGGKTLDVEQIVNSSRPFLAWLADWYNDLPSQELAAVIEEAGRAERVAVLAVDVTVGFCSEGALSSERVGGIVAPIAQLFERAHDLGVRHFVLPQDSHAADAVEFGSYPPHCVQGTDEAATVPELAGLPFADLFQVLDKDSLSSSINTGLEAWLEAHPEVTTLLVVGDCTDLCVYQLAMHLRLRANALGLPGVRVMVPAKAVDTFDLPVEVAKEVGAMPHHGDLLHLVFLYSMAQNGVEILSEVT